MAVAAAPQVLRVVDADAYEGPVDVAAEDALYHTTGRNPETQHVDVMRLALDGDRFPLEPERLSVVRRDANVANGMALDGFAFGGRRGDLLFITADDAIWAAVVHPA